VVSQRPEALCCYSLTVVINKNRVAGHILKSNEEISKGLETRAFPVLGESASDAGHRGGHSFWVL
jgi:hypothetical protein